MAGVLVYSTKEGLALELLTAAKTINDAVWAVSINDDSLAQAMAGAGAKTYKVNNDNLVLADTGAVVDVIKQVIDKEDIETILLSSDRRGKELAGRLAQAIGAGCLTDVSSINLNGDKIECQRNALGGATIATQYVEGKKVIAIRARVYEPAEAGDGSVEYLVVKVKASGIKVLEFKPKTGDSVNIEDADILVAVGQGLNEAANLADAEALAKKLGGEVGCSKPVATDKKWLSEERIIGLSGKKCKPELALLFGISGQVQFTVGVRDARIIASVNTDKNAAINYMADYILQADLHEVMQELNEKL